MGKENPGYFQPESKNIYFYNGEAMLEGELAPEGWKIPSDKDWEQLQEYIKDDVSTLKSGEWQPALDENATVTDVNNYTHFNAFPLGIWSNEHLSPYMLTAFWSWDQERNAPSSNAFYLLGEENGFVKNSSFASGKDHYKALSIRCIKE